MGCLLAGAGWLLTLTALQTRFPVRIRHPVLFCWLLLPILCLGSPLSSSLPIVHDFPHPASALWVSEFSRRPVGHFGSKCVLPRNRWDFILGESLWDSLPSLDPTLPLVLLFLGRQGFILHAVTSASSALSHQSYPWICHPLPPTLSGDLPSSFGFMAPSAASGARAVGFPGVRRTASPYPVQLQYASIAANRILGLALPRLLAPLRAPI
jgi:hypothetical protein